MVPGGQRLFATTVDALFLKLLPNIPLTMNRTEVEIRC